MFTIQHQTPLDHGTFLSSHWHPCPRH
jgi:hypothetical protein